MTAQIAALAAALDDAAREARAVPQLSVVHSLTLGQAYDIQKASVGRRLERGERRIGLKMGFTSRAKMAQMGVTDMIWGRLTDRMLVDDGGRISRACFVHPRVEPEVAFLMRKDLSGTVTMLEALDAVEAVAPALEIIDSRYENFRFSLTDVVADNSSSSALVVGPWNSPSQPLDNLGLVLCINGGAQAYGSTAAILGDPVRALVAAARLAALDGEKIEAGHIVMAGGATAAIPLEIGLHVQLEMERLGRASFTVDG